MKIYQNTLPLLQHLPIREQDCIMYWQKTLLGFQFRIRLCAYESMWFKN